MKKHYVPVEIETVYTGANDIIATSVAFDSEEQSFRNSAFNGNEQSFNYKYPGMSSLK